MRMKIREVTLYPDYNTSQISAWPIRKFELSNLSKIVNHKGNTIAWDRSNSAYIAYDKKTHVRNMEVTGSRWKLTNSSFMTFDIDTLSGRKGSPIKAHEFYRAILKSENIIFRTSAQSFGGMKVWQRLAQFPDIEVFGWHPGKGAMADGEPVQVEIDPEEYQSTHAGDAEILAATGDTQDAVHKIRAMYLIAHRKIKS